MSKDLGVKPSLLKLICEEGTMRRIAKKNRKVRLDASARCIWVNDQPELSLQRYSN